MAVFKVIEDFLRKSVYTGPLAKEKPTRAPGSKGYKPTDTSGKKFKPAYMKTVKPKKSGKIAKGSGNPYTPTQLKPVGPDMGRDTRKSRSDGNSVPGGASKSYKDKAPKYKTKKQKKQTTKAKDKSQKRFRAGPQMASMGGMRKAGKLRGRDVI